VRVQWISSSIYSRFSSNSSNDWRSQTHQSKRLAVWTRRGHHLTSDPPSTSGIAPLSPVCPPLPARAGTAPPVSDGAGTRPEEDRYMSSAGGRIILEKRTDNERNARCYTLTPGSRRQTGTQQKKWSRTAKAESRK